MAADRSDQEHQHRGMGKRLKRDAIEKQSDRRHDQKRQRNIDGDRGVAAGEPVGQGEDDRGQADIDRERSPDEPGMQRSAAGEQVEAKCHDPHRQRQPDGARHLACRERGIGQRAVGDKFALRNQDYAGNGEDQHQRKAEQRIDRAVGNAVLDQEQHDRRVQGRALPYIGPIAVRRPSDRPLWQLKNSTNMYNI